MYECATGEIVRTYVQGQVDKQYRDYLVTKNKDTRYLYRQTCTLYNNLIHMYMGTNFGTVDIHVDMHSRYAADTYSNETLFTQHILQLIELGLGSRKGLCALHLFRHVNHWHGTNKLLSYESYYLRWFSGCSIDEFIWFICNGIQWKFK